MLSDDKIALLKSFVSLARQNPQFLHSPELAFYKEYLESLGAKIPPPFSSSSNKDSENGPSKPAPQQATPEAEDEDESEPEIPFPELDNSGVIEEESDEPLPMGDINKEVTDDELEKANEERDAAVAAFNEGNYDDALKHYTAAIQLNPGSALLHAKRANVLLKLSKPGAAIRDCDKAISINPDSAQGYKFRGRANRLLGKWVEAHKDLAMACKIDYDDTAAEWMKEVEANAKKLQEYYRKKERAQEEKELKERRRRVERAREANKRAAEEAAAKGAHAHDDAMPDGGPTPGAFGMGAFSELFKELADDPEMLKMLKEDPSLIGSLTEIIQNPANIMKHMGNPAVQKLLQKLGSKMGGFPSGAGACGAGFPFAGTGAASASGEESFKSRSPPPQHAPKKTPEPDLD